MGMDQAQPLTAGSDSRKEDFRITLMKGVCIVGVVSVHFSGSFLNKDYVWTPSFYISLLLNQFSFFAVPAFVFLSGWLLELRYGSAPLRYGAFMRRRAVKIGVPYIIVSVAWIYLAGDINLRNFIPRFFYYGTHLTLYFVPLIFQLYLAYPFFRFIPEKIDRFINRGRSAPDSGMKPMIFMMVIFLLLHIAIGILSSVGKIDYYTYCRPFAPFWAVYFIAGMFFCRFKGEIGHSRYLKYIIPTLTIFAIMLLAWNVIRLQDSKRVGAFFEHALLEYGYSRKIVMPYNLAAVFLIGFILSAKWEWRSSLLELFGRYSYPIYLWHLIVLYYLAWKSLIVMETCRNIPEAILVVIILACLIISLSFRQFGIYWVNMKRVLST